MADLTDPIDVVARTIWGEARGEPAGGMEAVGCVIQNRKRNPRWWGSSLILVCLKADQFSCWNTDDVNRAKLLAVTGADPQFVHALAIADRMVNGVLPDTTFNADSYAGLSGCKPGWLADAVFTVKIGNQSFYRTELPPPKANP